jgi:hypothetical protein
MKEIDNVIHYTVSVRRVQNSNGFRRNLVAEVCTEMMEQKLN